MTLLTWRKMQVHFELDAGRIRLDMLIQSQASLDFPLFLGVPEVYGNVCKFLSF